MSIELAGTWFRYGARRPWVLRDLSLGFEVGRTVLLGPNGAGKSTLLGLAASVLHTRRGRLLRDGTTVTGRRAIAEHRRAVAWMPQDHHVVAGLSVREHVATHGWLKGMSRAAAWESSVEALKRVDLVDRSRDKASRLSGGQRARMCLAQALVHSADALLLDEPTAGLDPDQRERVAALVAEQFEGKSVVVSTHDVADIGSTYDRVVIVIGGCVRFDGAVGEFFRHGPDVVSAYRSLIGTRE